MLAFKGRAWVQEFEGDLTSFYRLLVCFHFSPYVHIFFSVKERQEQRKKSVLCSEPQRSLSRGANCMPGGSRERAHL